MSGQNRTIEDGMKLIQEFLAPVRAQAEKEAAMQKKAEGDKSFKDTGAADPAEQAKQKDGEVSTEQKSLGVEQTQAAKDSGSTIEQKPNSEADAKKPTDKQGTVKMDTDQKVTEQGNIGPMRTQEITQEQKMAHAEQLSNAILSVISESLQKSAAKEPPKKKKGDVNETDKTIKQPGAIPTNVPDNKEASQKTGDQFPEWMQPYLEKSAMAAQEYFENHFRGQLTRLQHTMEVEASQINPEILKMAGGVDAILDKVAAEFPEAVMPEDMLAAGAAGPAMPPGGEAGPAPEAGAGGEAGGVDALAAQLDEAGVTPEDLQSALDDVQALQEAGVTPEELAQALTEAGAGGEGGGEGAPEAAEAGEGGGEEPGEAAEGEVKAEKESSDHRARVDGIKAFLGSRGY